MIKPEIDIKQGISDVKKPYVPHFGYEDQLDFENPDGIA